MSDSASGINIKRIPAGELTAYERWELPLIQEAGAPAKVSKQSKPQVKLPTAEEIERIHEQAYQEGFAEGKKAGMAKGVEEGRRQGLELGREEGVRQGLAEAKAQVDQKLAALGGLMQSLLDPMAQRQEQIQEAMVNLAMTVARSVIYRELHSRQETLQALIQEAFSILPARASDVLIRHHQSDTELLREVLQSVGLNADLRTDAQVSAGGLMVETRNQLIDFTLEKRFQKTVHTMLCKLSQPAARRETVASTETLVDVSEFPTDVLSQAEQEAAQEALSRVEQPTQEPSLEVSTGKAQESDDDTPGN